MIIRLLRGRIPDGQHAALVARLRELALERERPAGMLGAYVGFRRDADDLHFVALSTWASIDAITLRTGGDPTLPIFDDGSLVAELSVELYETADEPPAGWDTATPVVGTALGLMWGRVERHAEATAHEMIRAIAPEVRAAGVTALHVGRRLLGDQVEVLAIAIWRDRLSLHRFGKTRTTGTLDPAFLKLLTEWRFETYDAIDLAVLAIPASGPAILLADDEGRYVDASSGVEALLGMPAELILGRTIADLTPGEDSSGIPSAWRAFRQAGQAEGEWVLRRIDGQSVRVGFRAQANCPAPGVHASVLTRLDAARDLRSVTAIVEDAFRGEISA